MTLPPGAAQAPLVQTIGWLVRPIALLGECRRRLADAFSITFLGFEHPMVMISYPDAIRALYTVCRRAHLIGCQSVVSPRGFGGSG